MKTLKDSTVVNVLPKLLVAVVALLHSICEAQTLLSGNISGTWSPSGNPYVITDNATVPGGQTLTIQPGVIVWIGSGRSIYVNGAIQAVGTTALHITFQPPVNSQFWNSFSVTNSGINIFSYCDFVNATNALAFSGTSSNQVNYCTFTNVSNTALSFKDLTTNQVVYSTFHDVSNGIAVASGAYTLLYANIMNCSFSNCWGQAVSVGQGGWYGYNQETLFATIKNCSFNVSGGGCSFYLGFVANGALQIQDNIFKNVTNAAISLTAGNGAGSGSATLINNIIVNASNGVTFQDPWDAKAQDNIFVGCTNAASVTGSLSRSVSYNDFFGNMTNFVGYPSTYGTIIIANRNGTPCDLLYNIFQDPKFISTNDCSLQTNSPCIDAGTPDVTYMDVSFPPSQGTGLPDLGIYGGPLAANWLPVMPITPAPITLSVSRALKLTCNNVVVAGSYQIQSSTNLTSWANYGSQFYMTATSNLVQYVDATNNAGFFRLKSLP